MKRIGLIGAGVIGAEHARILQEEVAGACLAAISDPRAAQAAQIARGAPVYADALALIRSADIDAVVIASPDATHASLARICVEAGKPVLVEKPIAGSAAEGLTVVEAEVAKGRRFVTVGYMRRFDPGYRAMKATLVSGDIGEAVLLHNVHRNVSAPDWFTGAMAITNSFVHEIDISRYLLDDEIEEAQGVSAGTGGALLITMRTRSGILVSTEVSINARYGYHVHAQIVGSEGTIEMAPAATVVMNRDLRSGHSYPENWVPRFADAYRIQMQQWVHSLEGGKPVGASAWDGYAATAIAEKLAASKNLSPWISVALPERPDLYK